MSSVVLTHFYQRLLDDHEETKAVLETLSPLLLQPENLAVFKQTFDRLRQALKCHYACEEHGLFPVLNQYRTMVLMEKEHDDLLLHEQAVVDALVSQDMEALRKAFDAFQQRLKAHIVEEDTGIFPLADKLLEPEEKMLVARKIDEVYQRFCDTLPEEIPLDRPSPAFRVGKIAEASDQPITYDKLLEFEQTLAQHVTMRAGSKTQAHWSGQMICMAVLSGEIIFETADGKKHQVLSPGMHITIEPHLLFILTAQSDCRYMLFKVWPKPHFVR